MGKNLPLSPGNNVICRLRWNFVPSIVAAYEELKISYGSQIFQKLSLGPGYGSAFAETSEFLYTTGTNC
jgi:hypothetical protein